MPRAAISETGVASMLAEVCSVRSEPPAAVTVVSAPKSPTIRNELRGATSTVEYYSIKTNIR